MKSPNLDLFKCNALENASSVFISQTLSDRIDYMSRILQDNRIGLVAVGGLNPSYEKELLAQGFKVMTSDFHTRAEELKAAVTSCDVAVAHTGTLIIHSSDEDMRLATMLPDVHFVVLKEKDIVKEFSSIEDDLSAMFDNKGYTMFISGPSRTADIERILTLGAHGPVQLHIIIEKQ